MTTRNIPTKSLVTVLPRENWRVEEFCSAYGIGRTLFYDEVRRGDLKVLKIGKRTVVTVEEASAWQSRKAEGSR